MYRKISITKTDQKIIKPVSGKLISNNNIQRPVAYMCDGKLDTDCHIKAKSEIVLEFTFEEPYLFSYCGVKYLSKLRGKKQFNQGFHNGQWIKLEELTRKGIKTDRVRMTLSSFTFRQARIQEVLFSGRIE